MSKHRPSDYMTPARAYSRAGVDLSSEAAHVSPRRFPALPDRPMIRATVLALALLAATVGPAAGFGGQGPAHSDRCRGDVRPLPAWRVWTCTRDGWTTPRRLRTLSGQS